MTGSSGYKAQIQQTANELLSAANSENTPVARQLARLYSGTVVVLSMDTVYDIAALLTYESGLGALVLIYHACGLDLLKRLVQNKFNKNNIADASLVQTAEDLCNLPRGTFWT